MILALIMVMIFGVIIMFILLSVLPIGLTLMVMSMFGITIDSANLDNKTLREGLSTGRNAVKEG